MGDVPSARRGRPRDGRSGRGGSPRGSARHRLRPDDVASRTRRHASQPRGANPRAADRLTSRVLVIGLDCAPPELIFERWRDELPHLGGLLERGRYGVLRSSDPPITVPAWACMTSSRSAGALGIYGFRNRRDHSYEGLAIADSRAVRAPRIWDLLSARGRPAIVIGVPPTYPVTPIAGAMISCFLTPDTETSQYTYP